MMKIFTMFIPVGDDDSSSCILLETRCFGLCGKWQNVENNCLVLMYDCIKRLMEPLSKD
jgi:hypothetical protein